MKKRVSQILKKSSIFLGLLIGSITFAVIIYNIYIHFSINAEEKNILVQKTFLSLQGNGHPPAILFLHGFGGSPKDIEPLVEAIKQKNYAFKAILLSGHGTSPRDLKDIKMEEWLNDAISSFKELKNQYSRVVVIGFSMGGALALSVAANYDVEKLVLLSPYFKVKQQWYYFGKPEDWANKVSPFIPYYKKLKIGQINDPDGIKKFSAYWHQPTKAIKELSKLGRYAIEQAEKVTCETLWVHSQGDIVADFEMSQTIFTSLPSTKKQFIELQKSNHIILYDYDSRYVIKNVISFLGGGE